MMTRKDYVLVAQALADTFSEDAADTAGVHYGTWMWLQRRAALRMADALRATNPLFDRQRFIDATGAKWGAD